MKFYIETKRKANMSEIKRKTEETSLILKELQSEKYKNNQKVASSAKKIQEALKKENDRFGELAKEITQKRSSVFKSKSSISAGYQIS